MIILEKIGRNLEQLYTLFGKPYTSHSAQEFLTNDLPFELRTEISHRRQES